MKIYHFICSLAILFCCTSWTSVHDYHVSVTQMNYNTAQKSFEVSIRIFTDDLELGLSQNNDGRKFRLNNTDQNDTYVEKYIRKHFNFISNSKKIEYAYLGKEEEADATWIYLEIPYQGNLDGVKLQNSVLTDTYSDQINMFNLKMNQISKTILFKKSKLIQSLI